MVKISRPQFPFLFTMRSFGVLLTVLVSACVANAFHQTPIEPHTVDVFGQTSVESYITEQSSIAKAGLLANIGLDGSKASGAKVRWPRYLSTLSFDSFDNLTRKAGVVIASPNTVDPNYLYTWIRDASLVFKVITEKVVSGQDASLRGKIDQFFQSQKRIQQVSNPSGSVSTGGLGEPKFNIDETAFTDSWGMPIP